MSNEISVEDSDASIERFAIRTLSEKTGVNSVTLRAWERRYGLLKPLRTPKGHRLYSEADVQRVESIVRWVQQGVAVSKVRALLDDKEASLDAMVMSNEWLEWQTQLIEAALSFEQKKIENLYHQIFSQYPPLVAIRNWVIPCLEKLAMGAGGHFCGTVLISCLSARLTTLKHQHKESPVVLITSLSGHRSLWCFLASAILNDRGYSCLVMPLMSSVHNMSELVLGMDPEKVIVFAEGELVSKVDESLAAIKSWQRPTSVIGASFWLAVNDKAVNLNSRVRVYSEPLEGVLDLSDV